MPNNSLGDDQSDIPTPRDEPFAGNDDFGILRYLDGRRRPEDGDNPQPDETRNIHHPSEGGYGLIELGVFLILLCIALAIFLPRVL